MYTFQCPLFFTKMTHICFLAERLRSQWIGGWKKTVSLSVNTVTKNALRYSLALWNLTVSRKKISSFCRTLPRWGFFEVDSANFFLLKWPSLGKLLFMFTIYSQKEERGFGKERKLPPVPPTSIHLFSTGELAWQLCAYICRSPSLKSLKPLLGSSPVKIKPCETVQSQCGPCHKKYKGLSPVKYPFWHITKFEHPVFWEPLVGG